MILITNNITFRRQSSLAFSRFKQHEGFVLSEMTEGKMEFNKTSREIMLLKFRLWSRWVADTEDTIAFLRKDEISEADMANIVYTMDMIDNKYNSTIQENTHLFEPKQSACWVEVHSKIAYAYLKKQIGSIVGKTRIDAFDVIVDALIEAMLMGLYELWEIALIRDKTRPNKLSYTNLSYQCQTEGDGCAILERVKVYKKYYDVDVFKLENYSSHDIYINPKATESLKEAGFEITDDSKGDK